MTTGPVLSFEDLEDPAKDPPIPAVVAQVLQPTGSAFDMEDFFANLKAILPEVARILEAAPLATRGGKVQDWLKMAGGTPPGDPPTAVAAPEAQPGGPPTPQQVSEALYTVALYVASLAPTVTVGQALDRTGDVDGMGLLARLEPHRDKGLAKVLTMGIPFYMNEIMGGLSKYAQDLETTPEGAADGEQATG